MFHIPFWDFTIGLGAYTVFQFGFGFAVGRFSKS